MKDGAVPNMGFIAVFVAFLAVVVGGVGSLIGAVIGGFLLGLVENVGMWQIPTEWQSTIAFFVLFLVLLFRPQGLFQGSCGATMEYLFHFLEMACLYVILTTSFKLLLGFSGLFALSHSAFYAFGATATAFPTTPYHLVFPLPRFLTPLLSP